MVNILDDLILYDENNNPIPVYVEGDAPESLPHEYFTISEDYTSDNVSADNEPQSILYEFSIKYYTDNATTLYSRLIAALAWTAASMQVKGDPIADLTEDLAAEQKARVTYDNILRLSDDPDVNDVIKFLREREVVHFQRFGEAIELLRRKLNQRNVYCMNPAIDL